MYRLPRADEVRVAFAPGLIRGRRGRARAPWRHRPHRRNPPL